MNTSLLSIHFFPIVSLYPTVLSLCLAAHLICVKPSQQRTEYNVLKDDLLSASRHGETLLNCIKRPGEPRSARLCPDKLINVTAVERLLVQLEETERTFDEFWTRHEGRLTQCLQLRRFETDFRELQVREWHVFVWNSLNKTELTSETRINCFYNHSEYITVLYLYSLCQTSLEISLKQLSGMVEVGDSVTHVDQLLEEAQDFHMMTAVCINMIYLILSHCLFTWCPLALT